MVFTSIIASAIAGYLVYTASFLPRIAEAMPVSLESNQEHSDQLISDQGILSREGALKQKPSIADQNWLSIHEESNPLKLSVPDILKSMEDDRITKAVASNVVLKRFQRSPRKQMSTGMSTGGRSRGSSSSPNQMKKPRGITKREAQMPQMPQSGMQSGSDTPEMPPGAGDIKQGMSQKMPGMDSGMGMPSPPSPET